MRKFVIFGALLFASSAMAAVAVNTGPTSLVTSAASLAANTEVAVFEFAVTADVGETLSSVAVTVNSASGAVSSDLANVSVYKDDGDGSFDSGDSLAGSNTTVNVGSATSVATASNNTLTGAEFFVTVKSAVAWAMPDSITVTLATDGIVTSSNSPTVTAVTTAALTAPDVTGPTLQSVVAANKVEGTSAIDAGDTVTLTFSEATNKPAITAANIATVLVLNNSHSWLDGVASIGGANWNEAGTVLAITLSTGTSVPTIAVGDTVTIGGSVIKDVVNNDATGVQTITGSFGTVDLTGPALQSAVAKNTGGTAATEANDSVELTFNEATNKPTVNASNINTVLVLNNSHSWLDGALALGSAMWNEAGTVLTVKLSAATSLPTVVVGDTVTIAGSVIKDAANNIATGTKTITGSFATKTDDDDDDEDEEEGFGKVCPGGVLINGRLYKIGENPTVYLAARCQLKPFRGAAVFHARGHKFQNIIVLGGSDLLPVTDQPALPAGGTLIKGSDFTIWFVTSKGKKKGFVSENSFRRLGFSFLAVKIISDSDLSTMNTETPITENDEHPEGSIIKCTNAATVFEVKDNVRFPFTSIAAFEGRGHSFDHIALIDCGRFQFVEGNNLSVQ